MLLRSSLYVLLANQWITGTCLDIISARHVRTTSQQRLRSVQTHNVTTRWRYETIYSQLNRANFNEQQLIKKLDLWKLLLNLHTFIYLRRTRMKIISRLNGHGSLLSELQDGISCVKRIIGHYSHPGRAGQGSHPHYPAKAHWERRGHCIRIIIIWVTN